MTRDDAVSPILAAEVFERDRKMLRRQLFSTEFGMLYKPEWRVDRQWAVGGGHHSFVVCPAVLIDSAQIGKCWGRWRIEHLPDRQGMKKGMTVQGLRKGRRAISDLDHLLGLCQGHTEDGMKAGHAWNLSHRDECREYLVKANANTL